jgi:hypothetical protein
LLETVGEKVFQTSLFIRTLNLIGKKTSGNEISRVCGVLAGPNTYLSAGQITTFKFSLGAKILALSSSVLKTYINGVLALNKANINLLKNITSGTLELCGAQVEISSLSAPGTLIDTIKQGEQLYKWNVSQWEEWSEPVE